MAKDNANKIKKIASMLKIFKRKRRSRESSPPAKARPQQAQDDPQTPDRPEHIPDEIDLSLESPSMVSILSLKSAFDVAVERTSSVIQFRPPIRISNLLPNFPEGGDSVEKSLFGSNSDRGTPISRQPSSKKILFPTKDATDIPTKPRWSITQTKYFRQVVESKFKLIDTDNSGTIEKDELYLGVLMVHLELAKYAGASACQPASRHYVDTLFDSTDVDGSGSLDMEEFSNVMIILFSEISSKVLIQCSMTWMIIPFIVHYLVVTASKFPNVAHCIHPSFIVTYEEWTMAFHEVGSRMISSLNLETFTSFIYTLLPSTVFFVTSILTILIVPWSIEKSDHFCLSYIGSRMRAKKE